MPQLDHPQLNNPQRRRFLRTLGAGTAALGTAGTLGHFTLAQAETPGSRTGGAPLRYRETAHIRAFYATLRD